MVRGKEERIENPDRIGAHIIAWVVLHQAQQTIIQRKRVAQNNSARLWIFCPAPDDAQRITAGQTVELRCSQPDQMIQYVGIGHWHQCARDLFGAFIFCRIQHGDQRVRSLVMNVRAGRCWGQTRRLR
jgi:hypothetical protein